MNKKIIIGVSILALPIMTLFQNCSGQGFKENGTASFSSSARTLEEAMPVSINMPAQDTPEIASEHPVKDIPAILVVQPPAQPDETSSVGDNRFTVIHENAEVLVCDKQLASITAISEGAKVIIVNGSVDKITSIAKNAKLILVNSKLGKPRAYNGEVINLDSEQGKDYLDLCNNSEPIKNSDVLPIYQETHLTANKVVDIPDETSSLQVTSVDSGVSILNKKTNYFKATAIGESVQIKIKAARFRMTSVSKDSVLQLY